MPISVAPPVQLFLSDAPSSASAVAPSRLRALRRCRRPCRARAVRCIHPDSLDLVSGRSLSPLCSRLIVRSVLHLLQLSSRSLSHMLTCCLWLPLPLTLCACSGIHRFWTCSFHPVMTQPHAHVLVPPRDGRFRLHINNSCSFVSPDAIICSPNETARRMR